MGGLSNERIGTMPPGSTRRRRPIEDLSVEAHAPRLAVFNAQSVLRGRSPMTTVWMELDNVLQRL